MEITNNRRGDCMVARTLISRNYAHNGAEPSIRAVTHNTFYGWAHLMLKVESQRWHYKFLWDVTGESLSLWLLNPLSPNIHMQILQTDLHTFPSRISWENLIKDQGSFSLVITLLIHIILSLDNVWILLGQKMANLAKNCQRLSKNLNEITRGAPCKVVKSMKMANLTSETSPWKENDNLMTNRCFFFHFTPLPLHLTSFFKSQPLHCLH